MKAGNIFLFRQAKDFSSTYLLKPDFFKDVGRSRITLVHIRSNLSKAGLYARVIKQRVTRLGCVPLAPIVKPKPIAEFTTAITLGVKPTPPISNPS